MLVTQLCPTPCNPMNYIAHQTPLSMEFSRQEHWSGLPFPSPNGMLTYMKLALCSRLHGNIKSRTTFRNFIVGGTNEICSIKVIKYGKEPEGWPRH